MTTRKTDIASAGAHTKDGGRTAIIAGNGLLPLEIARALREAGTEPLIVMVEGEADQALAGYDHLSTTLGGLGAHISKLKARGVTRVVLAGGITTRPRLRELKMDRYLIAGLPKVAAALRRGDNALLSTIVTLAESNGIRVAGAHEIVPALLARQGPLGRRKPRNADREDMRQAWRAARIIGELDIGQGAVSVRGRVIALEGAEGTDAMLARVAQLRQDRRIPAKGGVLVKCAKPGQELRADLPSIGPRTIAGAAAAGLCGIAVERDRALVLDAARTAAEADKAGIFVTGIDGKEADGE
jgi:UDP-2,3-diacylglucosamine hydrolase